MSGATLHHHRLAAILAADAVGYSRLMAADSSATLAALDAARAAFREEAESCQGRIVDTAGDSAASTTSRQTTAASDHQSEHSNR